ncbi:hypothetical protein Glove_402g74 [Diversispora epigaea]|uniref:Uncharacterized protein n=1 Tax=Diversispora epigaea TaxID=1348612 RepID=A0A397H051_9GLOM|nr:hypothetical protein Glove_402g74 [Diversispora epigaea]
MSYEFQNMSFYFYYFFIICYHAVLIFSNLYFSYPFSSVQKSIKQSSDVDLGKRLPFNYIDQVVLAQSVPPS